MYNRYIPQPDGSFRRNRVNDPSPRPKPHEKEERREPSCEAPKQEPPCEAPKQELPCPPPKQEHHHHEKPHKKEDSITGFLQNLLPKDLDTGDLIVILLLLLLAGDCEEDRSNALLTLALYLFM